MTEMNEKIIEFVRGWFDQFDRLTVEDEWFTQFLSDDVLWSMPEGEFHGHAGFSQWYQMIRATFLPDCKHDLNQIDVTTNDDGSHQVDFKVNLKAQTYPDSALAGKPVNMVVIEQWRR